MENPDEQKILTDIGEFSLHDWLSSTLSRHPLDPVGLGDDCVVLDISQEKYLLLTTDRVPLSAHKRSHSYLGKLCVHQNFSDIICKGGQPIGLLLGTYAPRQTRLQDWKAIVIAAQELAARYDAHILGGDTKEAPNLSVVGCAVGFVEKHRFIKRNTAAPGDIVAITLKRACRIGLPWVDIVSRFLGWQMSSEEHDFLEAQFMQQNLSLPYQETRAAAQEPGVTASVDTSDGIGGALFLLSKSNNVGIDIFYDNVLSCLDERISDYSRRLGIEPINFAFTPGHIWENVFTITPTSFEHTQERVRNIGGDLLQIGVLTQENSDIRMIMPDGSKKTVDLFFNEGFRADREISNATDAWLNHKLFI
jgi:thiamine-monophosphate kinase